MNVDIVGRVRPPTPGEVSGLVYEGNRVMAERGGVGHKLVLHFVSLVIINKFLIRLIINLTFD